MLRVAAVTMVYDEAALLPVWSRHYAKQVGPDHCYVVDHGSNDALALPPGMNRVRIPRSPHDDQRRAAFISTFTASLLHYYDWVIHTDVDEIVIADPAAIPNLAAFCATPGLPDTVTAIGLDVQHVPDLEPPLDPAQPLGAQRGWVRFTSAMCKPVLTRQCLSWSPGFHCSDRPIAFAGLYLFHLHWSDRRIGLDRLHKTQTMPWAGDQFGGHQRIGDRDWLALFDGMAALPRRDSPTLAPSELPLCHWLDRTARSGVDRAGGIHRIDLTLNAAELWPIPPHFRVRL